MGCCARAVVLRYDMKRKKEIGGSFGSGWVGEREDKLHLNFLFILQVLALSPPPSTPKWIAFMVYCIYVLYICIRGEVRGLDISLVHR